MSILVYDEIWVREPRLMVRGCGPIGPVKVNPYFNGRVLLALVGTTPVVGTITTRQCSTKIVNGMIANEFSGGVSTDNITMPHPEIPDNLIMVSHVLAESAGGGNYARLYYNSSANIYCNLEAAVTSAKFIRGNRGTTVNGLSAGARVDVAHFSADGAYNIWSNGLLRASAGSGTTGYTNTPGTMYIGNRADLARAWDGQVMLMAFIEGSKSLAFDLAQDPYHFLIPT